MRASQLTSFLAAAIPARLPVLITGAPGVGKSQIVEQAAASAGADLILSHPAVADPTDAKGLPWIAKDGESATFLPFGELARAIRAEHPTVWFLDDLGQAPAAVQCFPPDTPVLTPSGIPDISTLGVGAVVIDAHGNQQTVLNTHQRVATGLVEITAVGVLPIKATAEHPFLVSSGRTRRYAKTDRGYVVVAERFGNAEWKRAKEVAVGDWVAIPIPQANRTDSAFTIETRGQWRREIALTPEFAKLCGYYAGDGWYVQHKAVQSTGFALDDRYPEIQQDLIALLRRVLDTRVFVAKRKANHSRIQVHDPAFGQWLSREIGDRSHTKRIPDWIIYHRDIALLTAFLQGYLNTDGAALRSSGKRRGVQWGTVSRTLALQLQIALTRYGALAPIKKHSRAGMVMKSLRGDGKVYQVRDSYVIQCSDKRVRDVLDEPYDAKRHVCWSHQNDGKIWTRVKAVKVVPYTGSVFNLEVSGSQSYTAWNVAVHNCSFMQLLLARRVNGHALPECVSFVAASNRRTDRAGVSGILEPVKSRFAAIVELEPHIDDWCVWALAHDLPAEVIAFLRFRPDLLCAFAPSADLTNCPLPRTWAHAAKLLALGLSGPVQHMALAGAVGEGAAVEFSAFLRLWVELPNIDAILIDPDAQPLPTEPATLYAVVTALGTKAAAKTFPRIARYAERLTEAEHGEFAALLLRDCLRRDKAILQTKAFVSLMAKKGDHDLGALIVGGAS